MKRNILGMSVISCALLWFGCTQNRSRELTILLRMMPAQQYYLETEIIPQFEKANSCKVRAVSFDNQWDIERLLKLDAGKKNPEIALVKTPFEMTRVLATKGFMSKLSDVVDSALLMQDLAEYHPLAAGMGFVDGELFYLPRKLETRVQFYRISKVKEAVAVFESHRARINQELKMLNGYGLPAGYTLESDPAEWDYYDVYVVGSIWANEQYHGVKMGRIAHRAAAYEGTALDLIDRALQLGAAADDILKMSSDRTAEMFVWEEVLAKKGIYSFSMWQDKWRGADIYNGIKDGKVFLAQLQQIDLFNVHGWPGDAGMPGYLPEPGDMGISIVPKAVSFALNPQSGKPVFEGNRSISTGGWWWGIPASSPQKELAYRFMRFITDKERQARECSKFGMIPVRKDILMHLPNVFEEGWVGDIFRTSIDQLKINEFTTVPLVRQFSQIAQLYVEAWYELCIGTGKTEQASLWGTDRLKARLSETYAGRVEEVMGTQAQF